jgi:serine/threonine protein kinase
MNANSSRLHFPQGIAYNRTRSMKNEDEKRKKSNNSKVKRRKTNDSQGNQEDASVSVSPTAANLSTGACEDVSQRYEKVGRVGQGTYGVVYKARDKLKGDFVALKRCIPHHESSDGFPLTTLREIHALRVCSQHPNIISLMQVSVSSSNGVFLVFEYCTHDLAQLIDAYYPKHRKSPFQQSHVKTLLQQLLSALEFVHSHYLLHRDVKLSNLLYSPDGQLKLADFGLSRHSGRRLTPNVVSLW